MKRFLAIVLTLCMLISMSAIFVSADAIHEDDVVTLIEDSDVAPDPFYPFIHKEGRNYAWLGEQLADAISELEPDYLYLANLDNNTVTRVLNEQVTAFESNPLYLFAVTKAQKIVRIDYSGAGYTVLYSAANGELAAFDYENRKLYVADGNKVIRLNTASWKWEELLTKENIVNIFAYQEGAMLLRDAKGIDYHFVENTRTLTVVENEQQRDAILYASAVCDPEMECEANNGDLSVSSVGGNTVYYTLPMSQYPPDTSFFTTTGTGCNNHSNSTCKTYARTNQCDGFARYVSEYYYHVPGSTYSEPYSVAGDRYSQFVRYEDLIDENTLRRFFNSLSKGVYVRMSRENEENDESGQGSHSFVYVSHDSNRVQMYDANYNRQCDVHYWSRDYDDFVARYRYFYGWVNHKPNGTATFVSNLRHKVCCSNAGCQAYIIEPHFYEAAGSGACVTCGYLPTSSNSGSESMNVQCKSFE